MTYSTSMNERGNCTIPKGVREEAGIAPGEQMIIEITKEGILLRPAALVPIRIYTDEEMKKFRENEKEVAKILDDLGIPNEYDFPGQ